MGLAWKLEDAAGECLSCVQKRTKTYGRGQLPGPMSPRVGDRLYRAFHLPRLWPITFVVLLWRYATASCMAICVGKWKLILVGRDRLYRVFSFLCDRLCPAFSLPCKLVEVSTLFGKALSMFFSLWWQVVRAKKNSKCKIKAVGRDRFYRAFTLQRDRLCRVVSLPCKLVDVSTLCGRALSMLCSLWWLVVRAKIIAIIRLKL